MTFHQIAALGWPSSTELHGLFETNGFKRSARLEDKKEPRSNKDSRRRSALTSGSFCLDQGVHFNIVNGYVTIAAPITSVNCCNHRFWFALAQALLHIALGYGWANKTKGQSHEECHQTNCVNGDVGLVVCRFNLASRMRGLRRLFFDAKRLRCGEGLRLLHRYSQKRSIEPRRVFVFTESKSSFGA